MTLVSSFALQQLRRAAKMTHNDSVTLRNPGTKTRGAAGGVVAGAAVETTGVSAHLQQSGFGGDVRAVIDRLQLVNPSVWRFNYTQTGLSENTQIIFGSRIFNVRSVNIRGADIVEQVAICDEIR